jgi:Ras-related protein Rab-1A
MEKENEQQNNSMKVILLGNSGVGKTNLINTSVGQDFQEDTVATTTGTFSEKNLKIGEETYSLNLWDTAGQEKYDSITKIFLKKSEIVIFVYDITDVNSFNGLEKWIKLAEEMIDNEHVCGIVGNKEDLYTKEQVKGEMARKYAESKKMQFQLVSAKDNPIGFINFLVDLVIEHKGLSKPEKRETIGLNKEDHKAFKRNKKCIC